MLTLLCTEKTRTAFGLTLADPADLPPEHPIWGGWYVNLLTVNRRRVLVLMSEKTLLSIALTDIKKADIPKIPVLLADGITLLLQLNGIPDTHITMALAGFDGAVVTKTASRSLIGQMNDLASMYRYYFLSSGDFSANNKTEIIYNVNETPQRVLQWSNSVEATRKTLSGVYRPPGHETHH